MISVSLAAESTVLSAEPDVSFCNFTSSYQVSPVGKGLQLYLGLEN